jgi:adenylate kinase family enzyme
MNSYQVNRERWNKMTIQEQIGNIGSEVGRAIAAKRIGNDERLNGTIDRALDLFDATTEGLIAQKSPRVREVLLSRDQFLSLFFNGTFDEDANKIENYFMQYALAARRLR